MPRYVVERTVPSGLPSGQELIDGNSAYGVTWVQSFVSEDGVRSMCVYDAPNPEAIRQAARRNSLPVDRITQVRVLEPYAYPPPHVPEEVVNR